MRWARSSSSMFLVSIGCGHTHLLLLHKDVHVELLLQHLVGVVDAELLEGVAGHNFKAENVQDADERRGRGHGAGARARGGGRGGGGGHAGVAAVDLAEDPVEGLPVDVLDDGLHVVARLVEVERDAEDGPGGQRGALGDAVDELGGGHAQELGDVREGDLMYIYIYIYGGVIGGCGGSVSGWYSCYVIDTRMHSS